MANATLDGPLKQAMLKLKDCPTDQLEPKLHNLAGKVGGRKALARIIGQSKNRDIKSIRHRLNGANIHL